MTENKSGKKGKIFVLFLIIIGLGAIAYQQMGGFDLSKKAQPAKRPAGAASAANVSVKEVVPERFIKTVNISGELKKTNDVKSVTTDIAGKVISVNVKKGQVLNQGDVVAQIDPSTPGAKYKTRNILSPFDGTVLSIDVYENQTISVNTKLASVGNPQELRLVLNIPEKYLGVIRIGTIATFNVAAYPDKQYKAMITYIGKSVNTSTRTVETELSILNADEKLLEGMFVKARLVTLNEDNVFVVPATCVSSYLGNPTVYVVRDGVAVRCVVTTGASNDNDVVITSGLSKGDKVVVAGSATDGTKVNVI